MLTAMTEPGVEVHAAVSAPPDRVWDLVSDITLMPGFSTELQSVAWAEGFDGPGLGAEFLGSNSNPAIGDWTTLSRIVEFDPPRVFAWAVGDPAAPAALWRFELVPATDGTRLRYAARIGPGRSGVTMLIDRAPDRATEIVARRLRQLLAGMETTVAGIKKLAESGS